VHSDAIGVDRFPDSECPFPEIKVILLVPSHSQGHKPDRRHRGEAFAGSRRFGYHSINLMRRPLFTLLFTFIFAVALVASDKAVLGSWEGDSKCMQPDSPCHDEHVLYQITEDKKDPWQLNLDAYKVIEGSPEFIGTLSCRYEAKTGALSCTSSTREKDDWEFQVAADTMSGRLVIDGKTLYRRVNLRKVQK
jgi:hypothetical protein